MDGRAWNSGYQVTIDGWQTDQWVRSIREVTQIFNEHGIQVSHSKVYHIQAQLQVLPTLLAFAGPILAALS